MSRRTELKRQYRETGPQMGVFAIRHRASGHTLLGASVNAPGAMNRARFELERGAFRDRALQEAWDREGLDALSFELLDVLPPNDASRTDPAEELRVLEALWRERLGLHTSGSRESGP